MTETVDRLTDIKTAEDLPLLLTVPEAGTVLRVSRATAYAMVRCGALRSIKAGRHLRVPRSAILELLDGVS